VKLLYKPFGLIAGIVASLLSVRVYRALWRLVDSDKPPTPTTDEATWPKVLGAAALRGVTFGVTRAAVDRASASTFRQLIGVWPGERSVREE
jgi:hypothetical protein